MMLGRVNGEYQDEKDLTMNARGRSASLERSEATSTTVNTRGEGKDGGVNWGSLASIPFAWEAWAANRGRGLDGGAQGGLKRWGRERATPEGRRRQR
jgi:hypothetical protein